MSEAPTDPVEKIVHTALTEAGVRFVTEEKNPARLDFYVPAWNVHLEVKRFHTPRISEQMARVDNVIAIQGIAAAAFFSHLLEKGTP